MQKMYEIPIFEIVEIENVSIVTLSLGEGPGNEGGQW